MRARLSRGTVEAIEPAERDLFVWDAEILGFGLKVTPRGGRIYVLQYSRHNKSRRMTIGRHGDLTAVQARREAQRLRGIIAAGADPAAQYTRRRRFLAAAPPDLNPEYWWWPWSCLW